MKILYPTEEGQVVEYVEDDDERWLQQHKMLLQERARENNKWNPLLIEYLHATTSDIELRARCRNALIPLLKPIYTLRTILRHTLPSASTGCWWWGKADLRIEAEVGLEVREDWDSEKIAVVGEWVRSWCMWIGEREKMYKQEKKYGGRHGRGVMTKEEVGRLWEREKWRREEVKKRVLGGLEKII